MKTASNSTALSKLGKKDTQPLTPQQVSQLRRRLFENVDNQVGEAHAVVMGQKHWSPTQARVFATMLNKVMPDLTANFVQHEHNISDNPEKMSRAELEAIASTMSNIIDAEEVNEEEE
jgi:hypothetical protein